MTNQPQLLVVTGMSGAGRSTAAKVLEDLGYTVIDNLPPALISSAASHHNIIDARRRVAVVVDSRVGAPTEELRQTMDQMLGQGTRLLVLFLDAEDQMLIRRYEENRRPHPLRRANLSESIAAERVLLGELRELADVVIDTTDLNVHQLRRRISEHFAEGQPERPMRVSMTTFGFKHGIPRDVDLLLDARFLPNPHWVPELRPLTGTDPAVRDYVMGFEDASTFLNKVQDLLEFLMPRFVTEGKSYLAIGIGCTGGRHRSVALAEELGRWLGGREIDVSIDHRDAER